MTSNRTMDRQVVNDGEGQYTEILPENESLIKKAEEEIKEIEDERDRQQRLLDSITAHWEKKKADLEVKIEELNNKVFDRRDKLDHLHAPPVEVEQAPGPEGLRWVEGNCFTILTLTIVVLNTVFMIVHRMYDLSKEIEYEIWLANHVFLAYYCVEFLLKLVFWQHKLLCFRPFREIWSNWLDLIVVTCGLVDLFVYPGANAAYLRVLRLLRLARLVRVFKASIAVWHILKQDTSWAEGDRFAVFMMGVIMVNCLTMGIESDNHDWFLWRYIHQCFMVIYAFEIVMRLTIAGCPFFYNAEKFWNIFDFTIVFGSALDMWFLPGLNMGLWMMGNAPIRKGLLGPVMNLLRMLRLFRVLRVIRLVKNVPPLYSLLTGIISAMQGMGWLIALTVCMLYVFSLVAVQLVGPRGLIKPENAPEDFHEAFPNIPVSMWSLFMMMNGDPSGAQVLLDNYGIAMLLTAAYMVLSSFAVLSVLTGVVCDRLAASSEETEAMQSAIDRANREEIATGKLNQLWAELDTKQEGFVELGVLKNKLSDDMVVDEICEVVEFAKSDVPELMRSLKKTEVIGSSGAVVENVTQDAFMIGMVGFSNFQEVDIMTVNKRCIVLERMMKEMHSTIDSAHKTDMAKNSPHKT